MRRRRGVGGVLFRFWFSFFLDIYGSYADDIYGFDDKGWRSVFSFIVSLLRFTRGLGWVSLDAMVHEVVKSRTST